MIFLLKNFSSHNNFCFSILLIYSVYHSNISEISDRQMVKVKFGYMKIIIHLKIFNCFQMLHRLSNMPVFFHQEKVSRNLSFEYMVLLMKNCLTQNGKFKKRILEMTLLQKSFDVAKNRYRKFTLFFSGSDKPNLLTSRNLSRSNFSNSFQRFWVTSVFYQLSDVLYQCELINRNHYC